MANVYILKVIKHGQVIQRRQISAGVRKGVAATYLQAEPNVTYVLQTPDGEKPITKVLTQVVGSDLHLSIEDGDVKQPQIVIQNYTEHEQSTAFATTLKNGSLSYFSADTDFMSHAFSASGVTTLTASGAEAMGGLSGWAWAGLGIGAAAAVASGSKSSDTTTTSNTNAAALTKVTTYASTGSSSSPSASPTVSDYATLGLTSVNTSNLSAINNAIATVKPDTEAKVTTVVGAYLKILDEANGTNPDATNTDPLLSDYQALGVQTVNTLSDAQKTNHLSLLNDIIKTRLVADVNTVAKITALSSVAEKIVLLAAGNTGTSTTLTSADFTSIGLTLSIPNSLLMTAIEASSDNGAGVNTVAAIKAIDTAYLKIAAATDGVKANAPSTAKLTETDIAELGLLKNYDTSGATGGSLNGKAIGTGAQHSAALNLLNDVLDGKASGAIATAVDVNKISIAIDKVMDVANGVTPSSNLTATDLTTTLGLSGITSTNLQKVIDNIAATHSSDGTLVDTVSELQSLVSKAVIETYANDQTGTVAAPSLQDYKDSALAPTLTWTENLKTGVNSVLVAKHNYSLVHDIALSFDAVLNEATNGVANTHTDPTADQYTLLLTLNHVLTGGVANATANAHDNALSLMNDVVGHKAQLAVDTVSELENLATIVDHLINTTAATTATNLVTLSELSTLGLANAGNSNLANFNQANFNTALRATLDTGADIHTWAQLQALVNANA